MRVLCGLRRSRWPWRRRRGAARGAAARRAVFFSDRDLRHERRALRRRRGCCSASMRQNSSMSAASPWPCFTSTLASGPMWRESERSSSASTSGESASGARAGALHRGARGLGARRLGGRQRALRIVARSRDAGHGLALQRLQQRHLELRRAREALVGLLRERARDHARRSPAAAPALSVEGGSGVTCSTLVHHRGRRLGEERAHAGEQLVEDHARRPRGRRGRRRARPSAARAPCASACPPRCPPA